MSITITLTKEQAEALFCVLHVVETCGDFLDHTVYNNVNGLVQNDNEDEHEDSDTEAFISSVEVARKQLAEQLLTNPKIVERHGSYMNVQVRADYLVEFQQHVTEAINTVFGEK